MPREPIWRSIANTLQTEIAQELYRPGDKLPTEAELADRFGLNRHTVRQGLASLAEAGIVHARRGSGVFVAARPTDYALGQRVRKPTPKTRARANGRSSSRRTSRRCKKA